MGNNDLPPENNAERLAKSIFNLILTKNSVKVDCLVNMSVLYIHLEMTTLKLKKHVIF